MATLSTQDFLPLKDIKEGVVILKNGGLRGILLVSSQNFALMAEKERENVILAFQHFLNSLDFPVQIVAQSRRLNITGYLEEVEALSEREPNELLKELILDYKKFLEDLIRGAPPAGKYGEIMAKNFFVVVPLDPPPLKLKGGIWGIFKKKKEKEKERVLREEEFERMRNQLYQRMEFVALGLRRCGLEVIPLTSEELIEIFWIFHHPKEAEVGYYPEIPPEILH